MHVKSILLTFCSTKSTCPNGFGGHFRIGDERLLNRGGIWKSCEKFSKISRPIFPNFIHFEILFTWTEECCVWENDTEKCITAGLWTNATWMFGTRGDSKTVIKNDYVSKTFPFYSRNFSLMRTRQIFSITMLIIQEKDGGSELGRETERFSSMYSIT